MNFEDDSNESFELNRGTIFGEIGVCLKTRRTAYAFAQDYCILEILK
jgi:CRP-like cAMP-binding protein